MRKFYIALIAKCLVEVVSNAISLLLPILFPEE